MLYCYEFISCQLKGPTSRKREEKGQEREEKGAGYSRKGFLNKYFFFIKNHR